MSVRPNMPLPFNGPHSITDASAEAPGTVFPVATRTAATYNSQEYANHKYKGLGLIVDVNTVGGGGTLDIKLQVKDPITGTWYDLTDASMTQITAAGQALFQLYPGIEEDGAAGITRVNMVLPSNFRIVATVAVASINFSIWGEFLG
jgi:hypothetical protein